MSLSALLLSTSLLKFLGSDGKVCQKFKEKVVYQGNLCYHGVNERIRFQEQKLGVIFAGQRGPKNHFWTEVVQVAT
jgi:hypothetical protein